jgi:hypothetical protein
MRTDVHRPSSPLFDPQAYRYGGVFDTDQRDPFNSYQIAARRQAVAALVEQGYCFGPGSSSQCGHCGAHIRYAALLIRDDVREFIFVGQDCLDNRFDGLTKAEFQSLRKTASLNRERVRKSEAVKKVLDDNPGLEQALDVDHHIISDIKWRLENGGKISEKQVALVFKIAQQEAERAVRRAEQEAQAKALADAGVRVPVGRVDIVGKVLSTKGVDSAYGYVVKMLVQSDAGWKVWGTMPRSLDAQIGDRVTFKASITQSDDDPVFGFFSRPTNAAVLV